MVTSVVVSRLGLGFEVRLRSGMIQTKKQSLASVTFSSAISVSRSSGKPMDEYSWNADVPGKTLETKKD